MQREIGYLRCSKLSSYVEFNRMVQALSVHRGNVRGGGIPNHTPKEGTASEYNFYQTLAIMLTQVLHNPHPEVQRQELLTIYQWFTINRPTTSTSTRTRKVQAENRPQLFLTKLVKRNGSDTIRPHTAPGGMGRTNTHTPVCPPPTPAPLLGFTSTYITRSLATSSFSSSSRRGQLPHRPVSQPITTSRRYWINDDGDSSNRLRLVPMSDGIGTRLEQYNDDNNVGVTTGQVYDSVSSIAAGMSIERLTKTPYKPTLSPTTATQSHHTKSVDNKLTKPQVSHDHDTGGYKSQSLCTLTTIKEEDIQENEEGKEKKEEGKEEQKEQTITDGEKVAMKSNTANTDTVPLETNQAATETVTKETTQPEMQSQVQLISVTIKEKNDTSLERRKESNETNYKRQKIPHVITLSFDKLPTSSQHERKNRSTTPKALVSVVAGFNKQHYRPKTVA